jgi:hypothetical protein
MILSLVFLLSCGLVASEDSLCVSPGTCTPPSDYKHIAGRDVIPRYQWTISGGFCGSVSIQSIALTYGAWISQDLIRKVAPEAEGHGNPIEGYEILHSNIETALTNLHFTFHSWDWMNTPEPQGNAYLQWMKQELLQNHSIVQFILCKGDAHNAYGTDENPNYYDHIEPFFKLYTNHDLSDETVYADDVVAHGSDYSPDGEQNLGYFRNFSSLLDDLEMDGNCSSAQPGWGYNEMYPCLYLNRVYGYAMTGLMEPSSGAQRPLPLSMSVNNTNEPNIRRGEDPVLLQAHITISSLIPAEQYLLYRWDDYRAFPTGAGGYEQSNYSHKILFTAASDTFVLDDENLFLSSGSTYYVCVHA